MRIINFSSSWTTLSVAVLVVKWKSFRIRSTTLKLALPKPLKKFRKRKIINFFETSILCFSWGVEFPLPFPVDCEILHSSSNSNPFWLAKTAWNSFVFWDSSQAKFSSHLKKNTNIFYLNFTKYTIIIKLTCERSKKGYSN